jgi:hypothetical protein
MNRALVKSQLQPIIDRVFEFEHAVEAWRKPATYWQSGHHDELKQKEPWCPLKAGAYAIRADRFVRR